MLEDEIPLPRQVGIGYPSNGRHRTKQLSYKDITTDAEGWTDVEEFLPLAFDLVLMKTDYKIINGWHTGTIWESLRLLPHYKVLKWKKKANDFE